MFSSRRIAPQHEQHSDEEEINTAATNVAASYDMLHDANVEKDVFRTKVRIIALKVQNIDDS